MNRVHRHHVSSLTWARLLIIVFAVALAKLLYPQETGIILGISHLDSHFGFTGVHVTTSGAGIASRRLKKPSVDLNDEPAQRLAGLVGVAVVDESKESRLESLRQRCDALKKVGECPSSHHWLFRLLFQNGEASTPCQMESVPSC